MAAISRLGATTLMAAALGGTPGCSNRTTAPVVLPKVNILFELVASGGGSAGAPVTVRGIVHNAGTVAVGPMVLCPEPYIRIYDADRIELFLADPTKPVACPLSLIAPLEPGQTMEFRLTFDGRYFTAAGDPMTAPAGSYHAVGTMKFVPLAGSPSEVHVLTRELTFAWQ